MNSGSYDLDVDLQLAVLRATYELKQEAVCTYDHEYVEGYLVNDWLDRHTPDSTSSCTTLEVPASLKDLEDKYGQTIKGFGQTTTPAMETMERIERMKVQLSEQEADEGTLSWGLFALLAGSCLVVVLSILIVWDIHRRQAAARQ